ncbi:SRPBCC domain-containing protein [Streptomyces sp. KS 21]|uniref:SRPBCC family protein n=1 Tax=Streptomyces sp. KS 21 TaxID=2485150 RepID=UPI001063AE8D|nr:SRPBCC domain-containing protein [Streptomyces sp. KS 21]TDU76965.1 carbon monoxide dehydrogenase subunit G [Streptomyces sp. KS 21]
MEHQVFVPVPADDLRAVLRDPALVARCVPGLQQDADAASGPVSGRLKVRVGGNTVTYRGALAVTERDPYVFTVAGEGTEIRGSGTVKLSLALLLTPVDDGTRLGFTAEAAADGRAAAFAPEATATAVQRLLDRAAEQLAALAAEAAEPVTDVIAEAEEAEGDAPGAEDGDDGGVTEVTASVFDTEVPPPSLDPFMDGDFEGLPDFGQIGEGGQIGQSGEIDGFGAAAQPPAEAAHARRTMIGRSAEEVDHAPPRGRYAPVPAPANSSAGANLRWIAPAAALALASAVVVGRALRRRR